ncbi:hypothetical protein [Psychrobacter sp. I-STPA10]|uniref:hypothetical protein n=1 Tax=Psychrobacter sp. I-STPA10 TaxID=2585769 RepID=UPI001E63568C|nr:hypothetical protein [Psychrobacter sp. I-STPA10]
MSIFKINFDHITTSNLKEVKPLPSLFEVTPWKHMDLSKLGFNIDDIDLKKQANNSFNKLTKGYIEDFNILDVISLIIFPDIQWLDNNIAKKVAENWWVSAFYSKTQGDTGVLNMSLLFVLHDVMQDSLKNQQSANSQSMFSNLQNELKKYALQQIWHDEIHQKLVIALLEKNANKLANLAFEYKITVDKLLSRYNLPSTKPLRENSREIWIGKYFKLSTNSKTSLKDYRQPILNFLSRKKDLNFAVEQAKMIFDHPFFGGKSNSNLSKLEKKIEPFDTIFEWLKKKNLEPRFLELLGDEYRIVLRCWLGSGNYYQLKNVIELLADYEADKKYHEILDKELDFNKAEKRKSRLYNRTLNRFYFWQNYQNQFIDNWLLLTEEHWSEVSDINNLTNVRKLSGGKFPIALLKFDGYYVIENFIASKFEADFILTDNVKYLDELIQYSKITGYINWIDLYKIIPCLIHDHANLWASDAALCLDEFGIHPANPKKLIFDRFGSTENYKAVNHSKDRIEEVDEWFNHRWRGAKVRYENIFHDTDLHQVVKSYNKYISD